MRPSLLCFGKSNDCRREGVDFDAKWNAPLARATEEVYLGENDLSLKGDVSMGDNLGSLIAIKPKPAA